MNDEKIVDFIIDKIIETGFGKGEDFTVNCLFNFNVKYSSYDYSREIISMESCDLNLHNDGCNKELDEIDPDKKVFSGMYNDVYLLFLNDGDIQIQITVDSEDELTFDLTKDQYRKLTESFDYKLYAYDKDKGSSVFCGIHNDLDGAIDLAKAAYKAETERTDRNREDREVCDIDWVEICDKDDTRIGFAYYDDKFKAVLYDGKTRDDYIADKNKPKEVER